MTFWQGYYNFSSKALSAMPSMYGAVHILAFALSLLVITGMVFTIITAKRRGILIFITVIWSLLLINEIFFKQLPAISNMKVNDVAYDLSDLPISINSLMLYVLPFYIFIRNKRFEYLSLPLIAISSIFIGGAMLIVPFSGLILQKEILSNVYIFINATLLLGLGVSLVLNGKVKFRDRYTYVNYMLGMGAVLFLSALINVFVYLGTEYEVYNKVVFMSISFVTGFAHTHAIYNALPNLTISIAGLDAVLNIFFVVGLLFVALLGYLNIVLFRFLIKEYHKRIINRNNYKKSNSQVVSEQNKNEENNIENKKLEVVDSSSYKEIVEKKYPMV